MDQLETKYVSVLKRNGSNQTDRLMPALLPESVSLHAFNLSDWMSFTQNFAQFVHFYTENNDLIPSGTWESFFKNTDEINAFLNELETKNPEEIAAYLQNNDQTKQITPHLSLFITFLKLLQLAKKRFNDLTGRHLDFYFQEVLKLRKKPLRSDEAHIIFELAHGVKQLAIPAGTLVDGGTDVSGNKRIYALTEELAANRIKITDFKTVYRSFDESNSDIENDDQAFKAAPSAASLNGLGAPLKGAYTSWYPFGYYDKQNKLPYGELPDVKIGFSLASHLLLSSDGIRTFHFNIEFESLSLASDFTHSTCLSAFFTSEKTWVKKELDSLRIVNGNTLQLSLHFSREDAGICAYDAEVHGGAYETELPMVRFELHTELQKGRILYAEFLKQKLQSIEIQLKVEESQMPELSNDLSKLNTEKSFSPFGSNPTKGSSLFIKHAEAFQKKLTFLDLTFDWKNTPDSFVSHYAAYLNIYNDTINRSKLVEKERDQTAIVSNNNYFDISVFEKIDGTWTDKNTVQALFKQNEHETRFYTQYTIGNETNFTNPFPAFEALKFSLNKSFLQEYFPRIFAMAMADTSKNTPIPKEPYQPLAENVKLSYNAYAKYCVGDLNSSEELCFFHEYPFGILKAAANERSLVPKFDFGGELYIGLSDLEQGQQLSLLVQVDEGSENPVTPSFAPGEKIEWFALCSNSWKKLDANLMVQNQIDNFLNSGLVRLVIPDDATNDNTLLPSGSFWIKAVCDKRFDAVSKVIGIFPQAAAVKLKDNSIDFTSLDSGLAAKSISVLVNRNPLVKSITQPFNAVGGRSQEKDSVFYRRISERLHHKNRLVSLWDYERIVLEEFPEVYRVKCLNHTKGDCYESPGAVTLVVIPDTRKKNAYDSFEPRFSTSVLNKIRNFLLSKKAPQIDLYVINPVYEVIELEVKATFSKGLDENLYAIQLNEDLIKFLSPWAFDHEKEVQFGAKLHRNAVLFFMENLPYVDYITQLNMKQNGRSRAVFCAAETPKSILVSAKKHLINQ